ncbi:MAG TPA: hypothetical protein VEZ59_09970, partial [Sphingopyxis sp.]|nr:hypothetical protein [Sphingopyxis sp.]
MKFDSETSFLTAFDNEESRHGETIAGIAARARRLALIGCFRPRQCGIATFTADIYDHLKAARPDMAIEVYALAVRAGDASDAAAVAGIGEGDADDYRA